MFTCVSVRRWIWPQCSIAIHCGTRSIQQSKHQPNLNKKHVPIHVYLVFLSFCATKYCSFSLVTKINSTRNGVMFNKSKQWYTQRISEKSEILRKREFGGVVLRQERIWMGYVTVPQDKRIIVNAIISSIQFSNTSQLLQWHFCMLFRFSSIRQATSSSNKSYEISICFAFS